jgi:predicted Zn-dependent protease
VFWLFLFLTSALLALRGQNSSPDLSALLAEPRENSGEWHRQVGLAQYRAGRIQPTLEHLQKAIRLEPANEQYYLDLGQVLAENNAREAVVTVFEAARAALPESIRIQTALGVAYLKIRDYEKAKQSFTELIQKKPEEESGYQLLAECYDITRDWENTAKVAVRLRELNANNSDGWYYGASAEYGIRRASGKSLQLAETYVRRAMELRPGDWRPQLLLGKLLAASHRDQEAVAALEKAIALKTEKPEAYYVLGQTLKRLGLNQRSAEALKAYENARAKAAAAQRTLLVEIK